MLITAQYKNFRVKIEAEGFIERELTKVRKAAQHIAVAATSNDFEDFVKKFKHTRKWSTGRWWWKNWHSEVVNNFHYTANSNIEVFNKIKSGAETLDPALDSEADIYLKIDRRLNRGVVGYTYPNTKWQYIYQWVIYSWDEYDIAANLMHEYCHKLGYEHEYSYTNNRIFSVPYAIGHWFGSYRQKFLGN